MRQIKGAGGRLLVVAGPAVVHTGAGVYLSRLIELGYVQVLFAGNALAVHDVAAALYGTALGVNIQRGKPTAHGPHHHMPPVYPLPPPRRPNHMHQPPPLNSTPH